MKNKKFRLVVITALVAAVISTSFIVAFADQENNLDVPHEHEYEITAFDRGEISFTCEMCGETYTEYFSDYLNSRDNETFDMNDDGIINGKDYAYLSQQF